MSQSRPWSVWLATGCGLGDLPVAPGTWGSLAGLPVVWGLQQIPVPYLGCAIGGVLMLLAGVPLCGTGARFYDRKDPKQVVFDEIAAFPVVFLLTPLTWGSACLGFLLFRLFDVTKPGPIRWLERFPGGWGIMLDDTGAAIAAGLLLYSATALWPALF